jgi:hypothetical protein
MSLETGKVLVACPTYAGKDYALDAWVRGYRALTYNPKAAYQVDNTRVSDAYYKRLRRAGIDCSHLIAWPDWDRTFKKCWELILKRAQQLECYWVFSVEADNVPAPEALDVMVTTALYTKTHLVTHAYPMHGADGQPTFYYHELGCMLMTRTLLERALDEFEEYGQFVQAIFATNDRYHGGYCKLTNRFTVEHLDGYQMAVPNLAASEIPGLIYPEGGTPVLDMGTVLPPCLAQEQEAP